MGVEMVFVNLIIALGQLVIGFGLSMGSIYIGIKMFDKLTKGINEWEEIKKGNVAVGILLATVIFSIANVVQAGVSRLTTNLPIVSMSSPDAIGILVALVLGLINLLVGIAAAVFSIYIALRILDKITTEIDEEKEIAKGNVAVAIIMAGVLLAVSSVIASAVAGLSGALDPISIMKAIGIQIG